MFQSEIVRAVAKRALVDYCKYHRIDYMQGLNEVYAVSLSATLIEEASAKANKIPEGEIGHVESTSSIDGEVLTEESYATYGMSLLVFEGIVEKLCPANFSTDGITAVQSQLASFNLLVNFHEPSISVHLRANGLSTDMYAMSWFITLFARRLPLKLALRLWDVLLESSEPDILIYIAVSLLRMRKPELMAVSKEDLPEAMFSLNFRSGEEIRLAYQQALAIKKHTPLSFRRKLAALGFNKTLPDTFREVGRNSLMVCLIFVCFVVFSKCN